MFYLCKSGLFFLSITFLMIGNKSIIAQYNCKEINGNIMKNKLIEMSYSNSSGERGTSIFEYDRNGKLIMSFWSLLNKSRSSNNFYTYDDQGNIIKKYREFSDGLTSTEVFTYNKNNKLVKEQSSRSDGFSNDVSYFYDNKNHLIKATLNNYHGWLTGEIHFKYPDNGLLSKGNINRNGDEIGFIKFTYDKQERLIEEYWEFKGSYNQTFTYRYETELNTTYPSSNVFITNTDKFKIVSEDYNFNNESGGPSLYYYAENGMLEKKIFKVDNQVKTATTYFYDDKGLLTHSIRKLFDGKENTFIYTYNKKKQLTDRINYLKDSIIGEEHYCYKDGLLIKGTYKNFDYWLNGSLNFQHDEDGNLSKGWFKGKDGFNAFISFTHDENNNITKIHWEFTFGKSQTYYFAYKKL